MKRILLLLFSVLIIPETFAQDPLRFATEIEAIQNREFEKNNDLPLVVFTGSSSIRFWREVSESFPGYQVLNHGFGGSEFSDLIHYRQELIYDYGPDYLFIYEGDNDISSGENPRDIAEEANNLITEIKERLPETRIFVISAKPSISRWHLKENYEVLNQQLERLTRSRLGTYFIDVWTPMLDEQGVVRNDLFIADDLHMNAAGYEIWKSVIGQYLPEIK